MIQRKVVGLLILGPCNLIWEYKSLWLSPKDKKDLNAYFEVKDGTAHLCRALPVSRAKAKRPKASSHVLRE